MYNVIITYGLISSLSVNTHFLNATKTGEGGKLFQETFRPNIRMPWCSGCLGTWWTSGRLQLNSQLYTYHEHMFTVWTL